MNKSTTIYNTFPLLLLAGFIEGGAVMAIELASAKMIAPYYGNSLYVWAAVLANTLGGLALGYFLGGYLSEKKNTKNILLYVLIAVSALIFLLPILSSAVMETTLKMSLKAGIISSCLVFVMPPLMCFGMVSPLIVGIISQKINEPGQVAGTVYAISTAGGILFTFITGYFLIPELGLKASCYIIASLLLFSAAFVKISK